MGRKIKALLIDLEGTLYFKGEQIESANDTLSNLKKEDIKLRFLSNIDSKCNATISCELEKMGLFIDKSKGL